MVNASSGATLRVRILFWSLAVLIAAHFAIVYSGGTTSYVLLADYIHGTARLPFQYRALTAWMLRALLFLLGWPDTRAPALVESLSALSVLALLAILRASVRPSLREPLASVAALGFAVPLSVMFAAPAYDDRFSYPYDLPSLAWFAAALLCFLRGRPLLCALVFIPAALSRETCLLLIPAILLWHTPDRRQRLILAGCLLTIWAAAFALTHAIYAGNARESAFMKQIAAPANTVIELGNNWLDLRDPVSWPALLSIFGWLWVPVLLFWKRLDHPGLARCIAVLTPVWWLLMFTVGRLREVRVFAELTVFYWLAVSLIAQNSLRSRA